MKLQVTIVIDSVGYFFYIFLFFIVSILITQLSFNVHMCVYKFIHISCFKIKPETLFHI